MGYAGTKRNTFGRSSGPVCTWNPFSAYNGGVPRRGGSRGGKHDAVPHPHPASWQINFVYTQINSHATNAPTNPIESHTRKEVVQRWNQSHPATRFETTMGCTQEAQQDAHRLYSNKKEVLVNLISHVHQPRPFPSQ